MPLLSSLRPCLLAIALMQHIRIALCCVLGKNQCDTAQASQSRPSSFSNLHSIAVRLSRSI